MAPMNGFINMTFVLITSIRVRRKRLLRLEAKFSVLPIGYICDSLQLLIKLSFLNFENKQPQPHEPQRRCISCRLLGPQGSFIRLTISATEAEQELVLNPDGRLQGRSLYIHPGPECLTSLTAPRALKRAQRALGKYNQPSVQAQLRSIVSELAAANVSGEETRR